MSQVKLLKDAREVSYTTFRRNLAALTRAASSSTTSSPNLQRKLDHLTEALDNLNAAHTAWKSKAGLSATDLAEETFSDTWLQDRWEEADIQIDIATETLHRADEASKSPADSTERLLLEERMKSLQLSITNKIEKVSDELNAANVSKLPVATLSSILNEVGQQLNQSHRELSKSIVALLSDNVPETISNHEGFHQKIERVLVDLQLSLAKHTPESKPEPAVLQNPAQTARRRVEIEKCKVPMFAGDTIAYPEFKQSWQKVVGSHWDDESQLEQLKFKVDSHTKRIISRCKTMSEVWAALDAEYAQEEEVVNAVNSQLQKLRLAECTTPEYIVNLRNHLPVLQDALESVNGLEHLQTPDKVNFLVDKFDDLTQREWQYFKCKSTGKTWDRFFSFILDRYDACRSTIARLRSRENLMDPPPNTVSVTPNATTASCVKCVKWVAKGGSYSCPACRHEVTEGNPIGHCLEHCQTYVLMTANQCSDYVRDASWCPVHLSSTHNLDACTQKGDL